MTPDTALVGQIAVTQPLRPSMELYAELAGAAGEQGVGAAGLGVVIARRCKGSFGWSAWFPARAQQGRPDRED